MAHKFKRSGWDGNGIKAIPEHDHGPATLTDSSPNLDAMCCCGPLSSPERPQLGPRMLLYFSTAVVGGNETELNQGLRVTFTAHRRHMPTAAAGSYSDRRKRLNFLELSFAAIGPVHLSYEPYCFSK